jgi:hypothetical protein
MINAKTPISRREILIGCAATMAQSRDFPSGLLPVNPNPRALLRRRNKFKETFTRAGLRRKMEHRFSIKTGARVLRSCFRTVGL